MKVKFFLSCLLLSLAYANTHAQLITISGSVMDQNGQPLQGATVVQTSTTNTAVTDQQGLFKLLVSFQKGTLEVSYIGYITAVIPLNNRSSFHIVLKEANFKSR
ncbi:MAG: carboxypeptidase-like regulatory domain-containing protein [Segetibacter sp.]